MQHRVEVIDGRIAAILARKTPAERIAMANAAHRMARQFLRCRIRQLFPQWDPEAQQCEYLRRLLGHGASGYLAARR
jgi:hypothetical protein